MIINYSINTDISVNNLMDLKKLKGFEEETNIKINKNELAHELNVDRRTVSKYINGYEKPTTRLRETQFDRYFNTIKKSI